MMNTDKTLILALALACAACPAVAADAPQAAAGTAPAATSAAAAPAEAAAADKPAAPKPKRKKPKAAKPAAAEAKASDAQPADAQPVDAPAAGPAPSEPEPAGAATAPPATAMPQAARVRVKDRASASAAVAAARAPEATPEASSAPAAPGAAATPSAGEPAGAPAAQAAPAAPPPVAVQEQPHEHADDHAHAKAQAAPEPAAPAEDIARAAECNPPFKSEIAALFDRWNASLRSGDPKKVVANYAPGSVLLPTVSDRARFTVAEKEEYFAHFLQRRPEGRIDDRVIDVDCNSATDSGLYTLRFGDGTQVKARYTFAYKRVDGEWLIASHHSSGMPQKAEPAAEPKPARAAAKPVEDTKNWVRFP